MEKARRQLDKLVATDKLVKKDEDGASAYYPVFAAFRSTREDAS